ncbi:MAG: hypothetical protein VX460_11915 [Planctomycetota bacterium]|nr:hypothetical protein [Planctomycetota bacterium]
MRRSAAALAAALAAVGCAAPPAPLRPGGHGAQGDRIQRAIARDPYISQLEARSVLDSFVGSRSLDAGEAWSPLDDQLEAGISWQPPLSRDGRTGRWLLDDALAWDFGLRFAYDEADLPGLGGNDVLRSRTYDLSGGIILDAGLDDLIVSPYVGAGMALLFTDIERVGPDIPFEESDSVVAGYVRGGARLRLDGRRHVGVDVRWLLGADDAIDGVGAGADAVTVSFLMGVRF